MHALNKKEKFEVAGGVKICICEDFRGEFVLQTSSATIFKNNKTEECMSAEICEKIVCCTEENMGFVTTWSYLDTDLTPPRTGGICKTKRNDWGIVGETILPLPLPLIVKDK